MRRLILLALLAASCLPTAQARRFHGGTPTGGGATLVFNCTSFGGTGCNSSTINTNSDAVQFYGSVINLGIAATGNHQAGGVWYKTQQNISTFTTDFSFQIASGLTVPSILGITFCVQNSNSSTNPSNPGDEVSADANLSGYGGYSGQYPVGNSIAVKFDLGNNNGQGLNYPSAGAPNSTGLYINGGPLAVLSPFNDLNPTGINLYSGDVFQAHIVYDGSLLTMVLKDTTAGTAARYTWPVDIELATGSSDAWVGFTVGEIVDATNDLISWDFYDGYNTRLATPTFSVASGSYSSTQTVTINAPSGSTVYYTTNGLPPTSTSTVYSGPITVSSSELVQAVAVESNFTDSLVGSANYTITSGDNVIDLGSGFASASGLIKTVGYGSISGSAIQLTDGTSTSNGEVGGAWYVAPVNIQSFTTQFTLQWTSATANGLTFTIQNQPAASEDSSIQWVSGGPLSLASVGTGLGYSTAPGSLGQVAGLLSSVSIAFDLYTSANSVGLYTDGALPTGSQTTITGGLSLASGHPIQCTLTYDGTTLALTMLDTTNMDTFSKSWTVNIPSEVGANTAYVGFGASTYFNLDAIQDVNSWTYHN